jgi:hypothetical protein
MKCLKTKIKNIKWDFDNFYIECTDAKLKINIIEGSVDITIKNDNDDLVGISYLEEDDIIKILYNNSDNEYIKPIKIYVNIKYEFNSESSESQDLY